VNWDVFLDAVTEGIRPKFGVVRLMYDAATGSPVTGMAELRDGRAYVASGKGACEFAPGSFVPSGWYTCI